MKTILLLSLCTVGLFAQDLKLMPPRTTGGTPLRDALTKRCSMRDFTGEALSAQQLSDLFYAACGMNRKSDKKLTIPTARNVQDLVLYAATEQGIYRYEAASHTLKLCKKGDFRARLGMQKAMFQKAAVVLIYTSDLAKLNFGATDAEKKIYAGVHAGFAMQNVGLFCAAEGLGNVVIGSYDRTSVPEILGLDDKHPVLMAQLVGIPK